MIPPLTLLQKWTMRRAGSIAPSDWNDFLADLISVLSSLRVTSFVGGLVSYTRDGTTLTSLDGGGSSSDHPFKIIRVGDTKVKVLYGQVNTGITIPEINGTPLDEGPELTVSTTPGKYHVYIEGNLVSATSSTFASLDIKSVEDDLPADTTTMFNLSLGVVVIEDVGGNPTITKIHQGIYDSIGYEKACGSGHFFWRL